MLYVEGSVEFLTNIQAESMICGGNTPDDILSWGQVEKVDNG